MAAAMGFSSFGTQPAHPAKRKKTAHHAEGSAATDGNTLPLGVAKKRLGRDYRLEEEEEEGKGIAVEQGIGGSLLQQQEEEEGAGHNTLQEGGLVDSALGRRSGTVDDDDDDAAALEKRQSELLRRINGDNDNDGRDAASPMRSAAAGGRPPSARADADYDIVAGETGGTHVDDSRELRRARGTQAATAGAFDGYTWAQWKQGVRDKKGDMAFYDASFVEDPWVRLRGVKG